MRRRNLDSRRATPNAIAVAEEEAPESANDRARASDDAAPAGLAANNGLFGLLLEDQLAAELNRAPVTLRRWRKKGIGPPWVPVGRDVCYRIDAVQSWLISRERGSGSPSDRSRRRRGAPGRK